jgi:hypothetical protein
VVFIATLLCSTWEDKHNMPARDLQLRGSLQEARLPGNGSKVAKCKDIVQLFGLWKRIFIGQTRLGELPASQEIDRWFHLLLKKQAYVKIT